MDGLDDRINELFAKISLLRAKQDKLDEELSQLQNELKSFIEKPGMIKTGTSDDLTGLMKGSNLSKNVPKPAIQKLQKSALPKPIRSHVPRQKLEDFIGTNLISKVGILITIIGIFIGAKYAIDKELISPAMRIFLGYVSAAGLTVFAARLKKKYKNFSAVLMGGGLAVFYFITYIAFGFYHLFPQSVSFFLMVIITIASVLIALWYNQKIIAVVGQVAAYAIPFLLSNGSGNIVILFSYITIINTGLMILSFRRDWKILYRFAFFLTWLIYMLWLVTEGPVPRHSSTVLTFLFLNFFTFYFTFLAYKVFKKELYDVNEIAVLLLNALFFYFLGAELINRSFSNPHVLTYFTLANAVIHLIAGIIIYRLKLADRSVFQFIIGLGLLFITIAVPVELNGSWVTLLWAIEAAILFWVAMKNNRQSYLSLIYPLVLLAAFSLLQDWIVAYPHLNNNLFSDRFQNSPFLNFTFWSSCIVDVCFGYLTWMSFKNKIEGVNFTAIFYRAILPVLFIGILYLTFFNEIEYAYDKSNSLLLNQFEGLFMKWIALLIYSFLFVGLVLLANIRFLKSSPVSRWMLIAAFFCSLFYLFVGLPALSHLRDDYYLMKNRGVTRSLFSLGARYLCFIALGFLAWCCNSAKEGLANNRVNKIFSAIFNIILLATICSEFINWMDIFGYKDQYKLGLTIIWGLYALALIITGIKFKRKHLRIGAIFLFAVTLIKLFFYDMGMLSTVSKTIVLVLLGIILLIVSFLYNKYKSLIFNDDET
jgi:uncharacterized membrane protein